MKNNNLPTWKIEIENWKDFSPECFGPLNNQTKLHIKKCNLCLWKSANSAVRRSLKSSKKPWDRA
nr:hypothetical protein [Ignavibacterium sp.]